MKFLTELLIACLDFFEAEAGALRRGVVRVGFSLVLLVVGGVMALGAVGFFTAAIYLQFASFVSPVVASLITGGILLVATLVLGGLARWLGSR